MNIYSVLVCLACLVGGALLSELAGDDDGGCLAPGCLLTWLLGLLIGFGLYWLLVGIHSWFKWLADKF
jgi:hypothetical protein